MDYKYTRHQVARGTRPDAEVGDRVYLVKNVSTLRATYQIRLLAFMTMERQSKLILKVPKTCRFHRSLVELMKATKHIKREDI